MRVRSGADASSRRALFAASLLEPAWQCLRDARFSSRRQTPPWPAMGRELRAMVEATLDLAQSLRNLGESGRSPVIGELGAAIESGDRPIEQKFGIDRRTRTCRSISIIDGTRPPQLGELRVGRRRPSRGLPVVAARTVRDPRETFCSGCFESVASRAATASRRCSSSMSSAVTPSSAAWSAMMLLSHSPSDIPARRAAALAASRASKSTPSTFQGTALVIPSPGSAQALCWSRHRWQKSGITCVYPSILPDFPGAW